MADDVKGLLVKVRVGNEFAAGSDALVGKGEVILELPPGSGLAADGPTRWLRVDAGDNPWDRAHRLMAQGFAANQSPILFAEPDVVQEFKIGKQAKAAATRCRSDTPKDDGL